MVRNKVTPKLVKLFNNPKGWSGDDRGGHKTIKFNNAIIGVSFEFRRRGGNASRVGKVLIVRGDWHVIAGLYVDAKLLSSVTEQSYHGQNVAIERAIYRLVGTEGNATIIKSAYEKEATWLRAQQSPKQ